jgi:hypothetical protein
LNVVVFLSNKGKNVNSINNDPILKGSYFSVLRHWGKVTKKNINNTYLNNLIHKDVAIRTKFQTSKLVNGNINYRENTPEDISGDKLNHYYENLNKEIKACKIFMQLKVIWKDTS